MNMIEELLKIEHLRNKLTPHAKVCQEAVITHKNNQYPLYSFDFGRGDAATPTLILVGGVHGLEKIGTQVILSYMETLHHLLSWDSTTHNQFDNLRLVFYPCVNPVGMTQNTRSNGQGVDIMRNAPIVGESIPRFFIPGGHRLSPKLPWYRGHKNKPEMEIETQTLIQVIERYKQISPFTIALDLHSGFGFNDRIWFPFAFSKRTFPRVGEVVALKQLLDTTFPYNIYSIEPQSRQYRAHGDVWDHLFIEHEKQQPEKLFIPLCLELGSWNWIRKNPKQIFKPTGIFNPMIPHRERRTLRRHFILLDFLVRAVASYQNWAILDQKQQLALQIKAQSLWG